MADLEPVPHGNTVHSDMAEWEPVPRGNTAHSDMAEWDFVSHHNIAVLYSAVDSAQADRRFLADSAEPVSAVFEAAEDFALHGGYKLYWYSGCLNYFCLT
jgi:hypothetical protein